MGTATNVEQDPPQGTVLETLLAERFKSGKYAMIGIDLHKGMLERSGGVDNPARLRRMALDILEATRNEAAAIKINVSFELRHGSHGLVVLEEVAREALRTTMGTSPFVIDIKAGDIDTSALGYAELAFDRLNAHGITWHPYMGLEAYADVFARYSDRHFFVLCKTSNKGAGEFQDREVYVSTEEACELLRLNGREPDQHPAWTPAGGGYRVPLYQLVAMRVGGVWPANCGLVVGATAIPQLIAVRHITRPSILPLIPGVGAQGGELEGSIRHGINSNGVVLINIGRDIVAPKPEDFGDGETYVDVVARRAREYNQKMAQILQGVAA